MEDRMSHRVLQRVLVAAGTVACSLIPVAPAFGGNRNAGDVWVDNVGQSAGPGHEMDPHLGCQNINLWGAKLADSSGEYTIDGWPPSGSQLLDYAGSWTYTSTGVPLDVIDVNTLIAQAVANGDTPQANQGFHFKLQFLQDPQKHKTFWVNCPVPTSTTPPVTPPGTPPGSGNPPVTPGPGTKTSMSATKVSVGAAKAVRCPRGSTRTMKRIHGRKQLACVAKKKRHLSAKKKRRLVVHRRDPSFTG
jgi:hypothetical protein